MTPTCWYWVVVSPAPRLRWAQDATDIALALALRERVFCEEQGVPVSEERDELDACARHLVAVDGAGDVVGTLRLLVCGELARIGRIAVDAGWRRRGIASGMLGVAIEAAAQQGCSEARLAAQLRAVGLYERTGFRAVSDPFEEAGIVHIWMRRPIV
jgi:predicted GNAT family N-acyltransferase